MNSQLRAHSRVFGTDRVRDDLLAANPMHKIDANVVRRALGDRHERGEATESTDVRAVFRASVRVL
jgi:hypothetical protein